MTYQSQPFVAQQCLQLGTPLLAALPRKIVRDTSGLKAPTASIITRTQADTTIQLSHAQYRFLAEICKEHAGKPLNLTSAGDMGGNFGKINYFSMPIIDDVTRPDQKYRERAYLYFVNNINTRAFRFAGQQRPECDWSKLNNSEIFQFIVWHEIGHYRDNFHPIDVLFPADLTPEAKLASKKADYINEILADRFAWGRIRQGQPMPLTKAGSLNAAQIARDIEDLSSHFTKRKYSLKPLDSGQYRHVPAYMLTSAHKAAYVGPDVNPELLKQEINRSHIILKKYGYHMHGEIF